MLSPTLFPCAWIDPCWTPRVALDVVPDVEGFPVKAVRLSAYREHYAVVGLFPSF